METIKNTFDFSDFPRIDLVIAALKGASILRVHDVRETADALKIVKALL